MKTYDVKEAAQYCKCHPETIREHIRLHARAEILYHTART